MSARVTIAGHSRVVGQALPLDLLLAAIPSLPRPMLARLTDQMIERLDQIDGDPDFEETDTEDAFVFSKQAIGSFNGAGCPVSDAGGGNVEDEGELVNEDGSEDSSPLMPIYGEDQSRGPINGVEGYRAWQRSIGCDVTP